MKIWQIQLLGFSLLMIGLVTHISIFVIGFLIYGYGAVLWGQKLNKAIMTINKEN